MTSDISGENFKAVPAHLGDLSGRTVANVSWIIGKGRIIPMTTIRTVIILRQDSSYPNAAQSLDPRRGDVIFSGKSVFQPVSLCLEFLKNTHRELVHCRSSQPDPILSGKYERVPVTNPETETFPGWGNEDIMIRCRIRSPEKGSYFLFFFGDT